MLLLGLTIAVIGSTLAQQSPYAPKRTYPGLLPRFQQESELGNRVGIPSTTLASELQGTLNEDRTVQRVAEWPEVHQPFWFKNRQAINSQIQHSIDGDYSAERRKSSHDREQVEDQKLTERLEQQRLQEQIEQQRLHEQIEQQRLHERIEQQRIQEEIEEQHLKEEREKQRLKEERERQRLEEEREQQRLKQEREHQRLLHQQQILHLQRQQEHGVAHHQFTQEEPASFEQKEQNKPLWQTQKHLNSGMRVNEASFASTQRPKKKLWFF